MNDGTPVRRCLVAMASITIVAVLNTATGDLLPTAVARVEDRSRDGDLHRIEARVRSMLSDHRPSVVRIMMGGWASTAASGVLVDPRGLVLTAGHVIDPGNRRFDVELADGEVLGAKPLGHVFEGDLDLAVLQLETAEEGRTFPFVELATAESVNRGDWVVMLGHAASISPPRGSMAAARLGRVLATDHALLAFDSPIDAGDSGGPILDLQGRLVGIASRCGHETWQNLGTTIDAVHAWMPHLTDDSNPRPDTLAWQGSIRRPGLEMSKRDPNLLAQLDHVGNHASRLLVEIREGERLVGHGTIVDRDRVVAKASLLARHARNPTVIHRTSGLGRPVRASGRAVSIDPVLDLVLLDVPGIRPPAPFPPARDRPVDAGVVVVVPGDAGDVTAVGIVARDRDELDRRDTPDDRPFLGIRTSSGDDGLEIVAVLPNSAAARVDLQPGDLIRSLDGRTLRSPRDLAASLEHRQFGDRVVLDVMRGERELSTPVELTMRPSGLRSLIPGNTSLGTSRVTSGFGTVHLADIDRPLHTVGSPVIDLEGRILGIAIARRARTSTVIIPWENVVSTVARMDHDPEGTETRLCSYRVIATEHPEGEIRLDAEDAFPVGTSLVRENRGPSGRASWGGWRRSEDSLEWTVQIDRPGRFEVEVEVASRRRDAGTPIRVSVAGDAVEGRIESTDGKHDFERQWLGVLEIDRSGELTVRLEALSRPRREVCKIASIRLTRIDRRPDSEPR